MKDQYFGDRKDYFKFDLALTLCEQLNLGAFTYVPMLTADDGSKDGKDTKYKCFRRPELHQFLQGCVDVGNRRVSNLRRFMESIRRLKYRPYRDGADSGNREFAWHDDGWRSSYFAGIQNEWLNGSLILVDPDNGVEIESADAGTWHKYIRFVELDDIVSRAGDDSPLMLFQYTHAGYFKPKCINCRAREIIDNCPSVGYIEWIGNCPVVFYLLCKTKPTRNSISTALDSYALDCGPTYRRG